MLSNVRTYFNCSLFCKNGEFKNCKYKILKVLNTIYTYAPIYTNFEGDRAPKKTQFFGQIFPNCEKTGFLACFFFKNMPAMQNAKICSNQRLYGVLGALGESI